MMEIKHLTGKAKRKIIRVVRNLDGKNTKNGRRYKFIRTTPYDP